MDNYQPVKSWLVKLAKEVEKMDIKKVVDDPEWQKLRESFVGTWKKTPSENVKKLREYLGDFTDPLKLRRVHNYLTGSGFRMGVIGNEETKALLERVRKAREKLKEE